LRKEDALILLCKNGIEKLPRSMQQQLKVNRLIDIFECEPLAFNSLENKFAEAELIFK
jgi:hypothetical protein